MKKRKGSKDEEGSKVWILGPMAQG